MYKINLGLEERARGQLGGPTHAYLPFSPQTKNASVFWGEKGTATRSNRRKFLRSLFLSEGSSPSSAVMAKGSDPSPRKYQKLCLGEKQSVRELAPLLAHGPVLKAEVRA